MKLKDEGKQKVVLADD